MNQIELLNSYETRFKEVYSKSFLTDKDLKPSKDLFKTYSLNNKYPIPKDLDVYCIVSGLPFTIKFVNHIKNIQQKLREILHNSNYYLVEPENLAVEYLVLKWPNDKLDECIIENTISELNKLQKSSFKINSFGFQFHSDGAIILRCTDQSEMLQEIRRKLISNIDNLPKKQSNWCHVPLGRILSSIDEKIYKKLINYAEYSQKILRSENLIEKIHLIHERSWYQTRRDTLFTRKLD